jgi:hypothetical protein
VPAPTRPPTWPSPRQRSPTPSPTRARSTRKIRRYAYDR